ncbi:hypothetical protein E6C67_29140 [Azospirillum sp. TSA2s]|nr:hypothetical protein E6C67_29140 [Azospirillum sp. TSA2s]
MKGGRGGPAAHPAVIPAQAGIQARPKDRLRGRWIPACAGMTVAGVSGWLWWREWGRWELLTPSAASRSSRG